MVARFNCPYGNHIFRPKRHSFFHVECIEYMNVSQHEKCLKEMSETFVCVYYLCIKSKWIYMDVCLHLKIKIILFYTIHKMHLFFMCFLDATIFYCIPSFKNVLFYLLSCEEDEDCRILFNYYLNVHLQPLQNATSFTSLLFIYSLSLSLSLLTICAEPEYSLVTVINWYSIDGNNPSVMNSGRKTLKTQNKDAQYGIEKSLQDTFHNVTTTK